MGSSVDSKNANRLKSVKLVGTLSDGEVWVFDNASGNMIPGSAGGGGTSFANTYWVDPNGNDGTGALGDNAKPFLTLEAARDLSLIHI